MVDTHTDSDTAVRMHCGGLGPAQYEELSEGWDALSEPRQDEEHSHGAEPNWPASQEPTAQRWLLLIYRMPREPSKLRSAVRRGIRRIGAVYLQNSAAGLPASVSAERALRKLRHALVEMSGSAVLLSCEVLAGESDIKAAFQAARNDEYEEIIDKCVDFIANLNKAYIEDHVSYAVLDEKEIELVKLRKLLQRVHERDVIGTDALQAACSGLAECEKTLDAYVARVYAKESADY